MSFSLNKCMTLGYAKLIASYPMAPVALCTITGGLFGLGLGMWCAEKITRKVTESIKQIQTNELQERARLYTIAIEPIEKLSNIFKDLKRKSFSFALMIGAYMPAACLLNGLQNGCLFPNATTLPLSSRPIPPSFLKGPQLTIGKEFYRANNFSGNATNWAH